MRNYFTFAGYDSTEAGIYITGSGVYNAPARAYEEITIPGRNGVVIGNEKRLENLELTYPAFIYANFAENMRAARSFLLSQVGYQRLEDTYYPDEFRLAYYAGGLDVEPTRQRDAGNFEITFQCKPERYLKSGQETQAFNNRVAVALNPTLFDARPLIRVYGTGTASIEHNGQSIGSITVKTNPYEYIDIDSDIVECFHGVDPCNRYVEMTDFKFPVFHPGETDIYFSFTKMEITPRWWML